jgi:hypothetical protein
MLGVGRNKVYALIKADVIYAFGPGALRIPLGEIRRLADPDHCRPHSKSEV